VDQQLVTLRYAVMVLKTWVLVLVLVLISANVYLAETAGCSKRCWWGAGVDPGRLEDAFQPAAVSVPGHLTCFAYLKRSFAKLQAKVTIGYAKVFSFREALLLKPPPGDLSLDPGGGSTSISPLPPPTVSASAVSCWYRDSVHLAKN